MSTIRATRCLAARYLAALCLAALLGGCGGAAAVEPAEEEVTATWTSGDDAALEGGEAEAD